MDPHTLAHYRERLQRRRRELVDTRGAAEREVEEVRAGRTDPEYEESAQADHVEYTLQQLSEARQREIAQVDAALARLDEGAFGVCVACGGPIALERLNALPYALRCAECAARVEPPHSSVTL
jgi:DnaK suppressor protein